MKIICKFISDTLRVIEMVGLLPVLLHFLLEQLLIFILIAFLKQNLEDG